MNPYKMVITVANQKGGCSKTTTAVNVATALAKGDPKNGWPAAKVLLVDMDPQGNVSTYLNQEKSKTNNTTTTEILDGEKNINPLKVKDNLYLIPSDIAISQLMYIVRRQMKLSSEQALFLFIHHSIYTSKTLISVSYTHLTLPTNREV